MDLSKFFRKSENALEAGGASPDKNPAAVQQCSSCGSYLPRATLAERQMVCPECGYHFRISARKRIALLSDSGSFFEHDAQLTSWNRIDFPGYEDKLAYSKKMSREKEAVICGTAAAEGEPFAVFAMEPKFMMGSMGTTVGEKITRLFEYATENHLPVVGCTASGGARMQEGILSLMQMAKVSGAVKRHSDAGNLYIALLTDPTTGGVTASFAMEADILIAEPKALIGFAGKRVIEQTTGKGLPADFQKAEFLLQHGFLDCIVERKELKRTISQLLRLHHRVSSVPPPSDTVS